MRSMWGGGCEIPPPIPTPCCTVAMGLAWGTTVTQQEATLWCTVREPSQWRMGAWGTWTTTSMRHHGYISKSKVSVFSWTFSAAVQKVKIFSREKTVVTSSKLNFKTYLCVLSRPGWFNSFRLCFVATVNKTYYVLFWIVSVLCKYSGPSDSPQLLIYNSYGPNS